MLAVVCVLTATVLVLVQARMRRHVRTDLVSTLRAESAVYAEIENARHGQLEQSAALIEQQPFLKALMSTNDQITVEDGSASILETSRTDLLALENSDGEILGFHARSDAVPLTVAKTLMRGSSGHQDWWFAGGHLYDVSLRPIVAGSNGNERVLGRMALGRELSRQAILQSAVFGKVAFAIERSGAVLLSSLPANAWGEFENSLHQSAAEPATIQEIDFEGERYLDSYVELPGDHPVRLYSFQSFDQATNFVRSLNQLLLIVGSIVIVSGAFFLFILSRQITRPLEQLVIGARQLELGDFEFKFHVGGEDEVADLTRAFEYMRNSVRQSRETLVRSARLEAVGRLAGGIAHDFNNLVMIIKGYSDLLLDSATAATRPQIEEIKKAGDRASGLTRQLLAFSRKQILEPQVFDLNQTVRNMVKMLRVLIGEDVELITNLSEEIGRIEADPGQLEQVIMNLAVNARDAMPSGGKLIIETSAVRLDEAYARTYSEVTPGPYILLEVSDSGCGMPQEILKHIFEPFFTTKQPGKGTGLGLATVYGIVKQSNGHTSVYSEPGIGTTFKIYLPSLEKSARTVTHLNISGAPMGQGTILLVEDEDALRKLAAESLKKFGYTVVQASNGHEALELAVSYQGEIAMVVTDVVMPRMSGHELVEHLKKTRSNIAVIFMSGYTETARTENINLGANAILLNKPFSNEVLARKISEILTTSKPTVRAATASK